MKEQSHFFRADVGVFDIAPNSNVAVPSLKHAIIFIEEQSNIFEHFLMGCKNDILSIESAI